MPFDRNEYNRKRYAAAPEKYRAAQALWREENREIDRVRKNIWQRQATTGWTEKQREEANIAQGGICATEGCNQVIHAADHIEYYGVKYPRALLCNGCNVRLGQYDHPKVPAQAYVNAHHARIFGDGLDHPFFEV